MNTSRKTISLFWHANMRYPRLFIGTIVLWTVGMFLQKLGLPFVVARAFDRLIELSSQHAGNYWDIFMPYIIASGIIALGSQAILDTALVLLSKTETKVRPLLQNRVFDMLIRQSLGFHANNFSGSLVSQTSRFTSAYVALTDAFVINILQLVVSVVFAIAVVAFLAPPIAIAMLLWTVLFATLVIVLTRRRIYLSKIAAEAESVLTAHLADAVGNVAAVKSFGHETDEAAMHNRKALDRSAKKYRSWIRATQNDAVQGTLMGILQLVVLTLSIYSVMHHTISIGTLVLIQVYVTQLIGLLWGLSGLTRSIEQNISDAAEMTELLEQDITVTDPANPQLLRVSQGTITFDHVDFTHGDSAKNQTLFRDFTLSIKPGEKIGLVGHSGAGKSTLTSLLLRFVDVDGGIIAIDGQDISRVRQADLRRAIAYVPQEPALFHRTLRENIAYGKPDATDAEIAEAARKAHAAEFIAKLPKGYDTMVGERGVKLSGGQRQRIAIARAILKNAPILVLDEATSALDSESEKFIQDALAKLMKNRTTIVIAHRLSTIQKLDRIVVLGEGRIIEQGTHAELLAASGTYAQLWAHQSGGFIDETAQPANLSST